MRGLHPFYRDLAQRFAEAGFHTLAMDYYGRTAGTGPRDGEFDGLPHLDLLDPAHVETDAAAALPALGDAGPVYSLGFCLGGGYSWRLAGAGLGLAGAVGFYGSPVFVGDRTADITAPVLMLLAGDDVATPQKDFDAFAAILEAAGKDVRMHVYDGAPHSFFDREHAEWQDACADAWRRVLDFTAATA